MHYYSHHIGDFIKATSRLTDSQAMAYLRLIWLYYDKDGLVENDSTQLAFEIGSTVETVSLIIKTYFEVDGEYLKQSRCDKELQGYLNKSKGGKLGAKIRWGDKDSDSLPIANPMPTQCDPNANHKPITNNHKPKTNVKPITPDGVNDSIFADYMEVRKSKKAKWTQTALDGLNREAYKAGLTLEQVMILCCERNWGSFNAKWILEDKSISQRITSFKAQDAAQAASQLQAMMLGTSNPQERSEACIFDIEVHDAKRIS